MLNESENNMKKVIHFLGEEFGTVRTGRASPTLLENIQVDYYGTKTPINHMANVTVPEPQLLLIQPWDKNAGELINKAILASNLGLNPNFDGNIIRLPFPPLTEERRKELVKIIKTMTEETKVSVRNIRRESNETLKEMEGEGMITEDDYHRAHDDVQKITDKYTEEIDKMEKIKEKEIMSV